MSETILRLITMLGLIPRAPRKTTVSQLHDQLAERGYDIDRRSIQRDLKKIEGSGLPIVCDDHKPAGWSWFKDARVLDMPCMDANVALAFRLASEFLKPLLPRSTMAFLDPYFEKAEEVLDSLRSHTLSAWPQKIRVLAKGQRLLSPDIDPAIIDTVYTALLEEKRFFAHYKKRGAQQSREYVVDPLGLVFRNEQVYLICCLKDRDTPSQLLLHRFVSAELLLEPRHVPAHFSLDEYIAQGGFSYAAEPEPSYVRLRFQRHAAVHLYETPLNADQRIEEQDDGRFVLEATVTDDWQLQWWLLSFGDNVEVLSPPGLRQKMATIATNMALNYQQRASQEER